MQVRELLMQMRGDLLVSVERTTSSEPVAFDEASRLLSKPVADCEVQSIYPEYYKGMRQTGITVKVRRC